MPDLIYKGANFLSVDEDKHETYSVMTSQTEDRDGEVCHYETQKPLTQTWAKEAYDATRQSGQAKISLGNMRWQHSMEIAGKVVGCNFDDEKKQILITTNPTPEKWPLIRDSFVTGVSHAGSYARRWCPKCDGDIEKGSTCRNCGPVKPFYALKLVECSYVDLPSNPDAHFLYVKASGAEVRKFAPMATERGNMKRSEQLKRNLEVCLELAETYRLPAAVEVVENSAKKAAYFDGQARRWKSELDAEILKAGDASGNVPDWLNWVAGSSTKSATDDSLGL